MVSIDTTAETGELHVKFSGTLSSSSNTTIRIWYNGTDTEPANTATYGRNNVWSDYERVYHAQESSGSTATDSTGNSDGTYQGDMPTQVTGQVGSGQSADGTGDAWTTGGFTGYNSNHSVSMWLKSSATNNNTTPYGWIDTSGDNSAVGWRIGQFTSDRLTQLRINANTGNYYEGSTDIIDGNWHFCVTSVDLSNNNLTSGWPIWVDGSPETVTQQKDDGDTSTVPTDRSPYIGARNADGSVNNEYSGDIDEFRIRQTVYSDNWVSAEYNNQNSPSTFYNTSAEQTADSPGSVRETSSGVNLTTSGVIKTD